MLRALLALLVVVFGAFAGLRLYAHALNVERLQARVNEVTARCAALNEHKHRLEMESGRRSRGGHSVQAAAPAADMNALDAAIDRCERELSDADLAWGAEQLRSGWNAVW